MNPGFIKDSLSKDLRRRATDPIALLIWAGIPLLVGGLMTLTMGGSDGLQPQATLAVVDQDDSLLSGFLKGALQQGPLTDLIDLQEAQLEDGVQLAQEGAVSGLLIIPAGFQGAILGQERVDLKLIKNPAQRILPEILEETLSILVEGLFYADQLFGAEIDTISELIEDDSAPEAAQITAMSSAIFNRISNVGELIDPPLLQVTTISSEPSEAESGDQPSIALLFFPGILFMGVLLASQGMSEDLWQEKESGTLLRLLTTSSSLYDFFLAKLLAAGIVVALATGLVLILGSLYLSVPLIKLPFALLWLVLSGWSFSSLMFCLQMVMPSKRAGMLLTAFIIFPLMMAGGSFFPFEAMPNWMASLGKWTPNGFLLEQLKGYLTGKADTGQLVTAAIALVSATILLAGLASLRLRRFATGDS